MENSINSEKNDVYSNNAKINFNKYEFEMTFSLTGSSDDHYKHIITIRQSPQFAKDFIKLYINNLKKYEEKFGTIRTKERNAQDSENSSN